MAFEFSDKKKNWLDERFRRFNGYIAGRNITLSRRSDIYYRGALDKELDRYIQKMLDEVEEEYKDQGEELKSSGFESLFNKWNFAMLAILLANSDKIVNKWLSITQKDVSQSVQKMAYGLAGQSVAVKKTPEYEEMLRLIVQRNVQLIKNATTQTMTNIQNIIYDGVLAKQKWSTIRKDLMNQKELSRKRMKFIAKDQTAKTRELINRQEQIAVGIEYFRWVTVGDERVRKSHRKLNGKIFKWNDDPSRLPVLNDKGDRGYPAEDFNCFTGDTTVSLDFGLEKLYKREYTGLINVIKTDTGRLVRATPNHPFLTTRGWVSANKLNCGDYIVNVKPFSFGVDDSNKQQVEFRELFDAFLLFNFTRTVRGMSHYFHGDGIIDKDINIIDIQSLLLNNAMSEVLKGLCKFILPETDMTLKTAFFSLLSRIFSLGMSSDKTFDGFISLRNKLLFLCKSEFAQSNRCSLTSIAKFDTIIREYSSNDTTRHTELMGEFQDTHSITVERAKFVIGQALYYIMGVSKMKTNPLESITDGVRVDSDLLRKRVDANSSIVTLDKVVDNFVREFSGHVYNLQNRYGYYTVNNGFVNHNCRCSAIGVIILDGYKAVWDNGTKSYKVVKDV